MAPSIAGYTWHDAYNFAIVNPGQASGAILLAWPLFIAFAAVCVVLSPLVFPGAMLVAYVLNKRGAQPVEKPKPKAVAAGQGASYAEMYPEVQPKANLREFSSPISRSYPRRRPAASRSPTAAPSHSFAQSDRFCTPRPADPNHLLASPSNSPRAQVRQVGRPRQAHPRLRPDQQDHEGAHHGD